MKKKERRSIRVLLLLFAIVVFHAGDLYMTIIFRDIGVMIEHNSIAAPIVYNSSIIPLAIYKLTLIGIGVIILIRFRDRLDVEIGCWFLLVVLVALFFRWMLYIDAAKNLHKELSYPKQNNVEYDVEDIFTSSVVND